MRNRKVESFEARKGKKEKNETCKRNRGENVRGKGEK